MARCDSAFVYFILVCFIFQSCIVPASGAIYGFGWIYSLACRFTVCCNDRWITRNFTGLEIDLSVKLHGQHLVSKAVISHIKAHFKSPDPSKALVLSFHGPTGVGKNFVSRIIAENIYKNGMRSKFVHLIAATKEFPHEGMVPFYKEQLKDWIESNVSRCERSMFIFDEVDKIPAQLLDVIKPYLDHYDNLGGVDYRKASFLFLSNSGTSTILNKIMDNWRAGKKRGELELRQVEHEVMLSAMNEERNGGLQHSQLILKHLITAFIPFLPLEKEHVRQCIEDDMIAKKFFTDRRAIPPGKVDEVMEELKFIPEVEQVYSATGCKRISEKVDFVMYDYEIDSRRISHSDKRSSKSHRLKDEV